MLSHNLASLLCLSVFILWGVGASLESRTKSLESPKVLKVATYNAQFLFQDSSLIPDTKLSVKRETIGFEYFENIAIAIQKMNPDVIVVQEVQNKRSLEILSDFIFDNKGPRYSVYVMKGDLVNVGIMSKWKPSKEPKQFLNFPGRSVIVEYSMNSKKLAILGVHLPSKRSDPDGDRRRECVKGIISKYQKLRALEYHVIIAGDLNLTWEDYDLLQSFHENGCYDPLLALYHPDDRFTHVRSTGKFFRQKQLDYILMDRDLVNNLEDIRIYNGRKQIGEVIKKKNITFKAISFSDHFPVMVTVSTSFPKFEDNDFIGKILSEVLKERKMEVASDSTEKSSDNDTFVESGEENLEKKEMLANILSDESDTDQLSILPERKKRRHHYRRKVSKKEKLSASSIMESLFYHLDLLKDQVGNGKLRIVEKMFKMNLLLNELATIVADTKSLQVFISSWQETHQHIKQHSKTIVSKKKTDERKETRSVTIKMIQDSIDSLRLVNLASNDAYTFSVLVEEYFEKLTDCIRMLLFQDTPLLYDHISLANQLFERLLSERDMVSLEYFMEVMQFGQEPLELLLQLQKLAHGGVDFEVDRAYTIYVNLFKSLVIIIDKNFNKVKKMDLAHIEQESVLSELRKCLFIIRQILKNIKDTQDSFQFRMLDAENLKFNILSWIISTGSSNLLSLLYEEFTGDLMTLLENAIYNLESPYRIEAKLAMLSVKFASVNDGELIKNSGFIIINLKALILYQHEPFEIRSEFISPMLPFFIQFFIEDLHTSIVTEDYIRLRDSVSKAFKAMTLIKKLNNTYIQDLETRLDQEIGKALIFLNDNNLFDEKLIAAADEIVALKQKPIFSNLFHKNTSFRRKLILTIRSMLHDFSDFAQYEKDLVTLFNDFVDSLPNPSPELYKSMTAIYALSLIKINEVLTERELCNGYYGSSKMRENITFLLVALDQLCAWELDDLQNHYVDNDYDDETFRMYFILNWDAFTFEDSPDISPELLDIFTKGIMPLRRFLAYLRIASDLNGLYLDNMTERKNALRVLLLRVITGKPVSAALLDFIKSAKDVITALFGGESVEKVIATLYSIAAHNASPTFNGKLIWQRSSPLFPILYVVFEHIVDLRLHFRDPLMLRDLLKDVNVCINILRMTKGQMLENVLQAFTVLKDRIISSLLYMDERIELDMCNNIISDKAEENHIPILYHDDDDPLSISVNFEFTMNLLGFHKDSFEFLWLSGTTFSIEYLLGPIKCSNDFLELSASTIPTSTYLQALLSKEMVQLLVKSIKNFLDGKELDCDVKVKLRYILISLSLEQLCECDKISTATSFLKSAIIVKMFKVYDNILALSRKRNSPLSVISMVNVIEPRVSKYSRSFHDKFYHEAKVDFIKVQLKQDRIIQHFFMDAFRTLSALVLGDASEENLKSYLKTMTFCIQNFRASLLERTRIESIVSQILQIFDNIDIYRNTDLNMNSDHCKTLVEVTLFTFLMTERYAHTFEQKMILIDRMAQIFSLEAVKADLPLLDLELVTKCEKKTITYAGLLSEYQAFSESDLHFGSASIIHLNEIKEKSKPKKKQPTKKLESTPTNRGRRGRGRGKKYSFH